jgi:internalin A
MDRCSAAPANARVTFADTALARVVADTLGMELGEMTCADVARITSFSVGGSTQLRVGIAGIQNLTGLTSLRLVPLGWWFSDLEPLSELTNLNTLWVTPINPVTPSTIDLAPLAALTGLDTLRIDIFGGQPALKITDLSPLAGLTGLTYLWLERLGTGDLSPLSGLTALRTLVIRTTGVSDITAVTNMIDLNNVTFYETGMITDLSPLAELVNLQSVSFYVNLSLTDIGPLLENPGIGAGDFINLTFTSVSCADAEALRAKGVTVIHSGPPGSQSCALPLIA